MSIGSGYSAAYGYDAYGRMNHVTGPGLPTGDGSSNGAWYSFDPNSDLTDKLEFKDSGGTVKGFVDWSWEPSRDLVASVENRFGASGSATLISKYAYANDSRARRTSVVRTGIAFASGSSGHMDKWGYNDRNELTSSRRYAGLDPNTPGAAEPNLNRDYAYDPIGNRVTSAEGTGSPWGYTRNSVNQYPAVDTPTLGGRYKFDPDGNLKELYAASDVDGDGDIDQDDVDAVMFCFGLTQAECPDLSPEAFARADADGDGTIDQDDVDAILFYFGATVSDTLNAILTWDGENRLVGWRPRSPKSGSKKCEFKYDYMGRRVEKKVYTYSGTSWSLTTTRRFVWRDWLRLMELDGSNNALRKWTWGRDLSGTLEGAGGIGGLLSVHDANETPGDPNDDFRYVYFYDVNGNVGQVVDLAVGDPNNTIRAKYEYDAYGNVTSSGGSYASANVVRFSTKPWDDETGMGDWGLRYYDTRLGRWTSNDPIGELGGLNLYAFVRNAPINSVDDVGWMMLGPPAGSQPSKCDLGPWIPVLLCMLNPACYCTLVYGPPAQGSHYEYRGLLNCVSVMSPPAPAPPPPPVPPPPPFQSWCGNSNRASGQDIAQAEKWGAAICAGGLWPGNKNPGNAAHTCLQDLVACIAEAEATGDRNLDDLCHCLLKAAGLEQ